MIAVIQRVSRAAVSIGGVTESSIGPGLVILLGVAGGDTARDAGYLARKISELRIFEDDRGKMNLSVKDVDGEAIVVSQFTLLADCRKGRRPAFNKAAPPGEAEPLYEAFVRELSATGIGVGTGKFGAMMKVELENDGPVTIIMESTS